MHTFFVVDAFTDRPFSGNPAAVHFSESACDEVWMQHAAREMNLAETAFITPMSGGYSLRWFTPTAEVDLCGHATLAAARVLWEQSVHPNGTPIHFHTKSGLLTAVQRTENQIDMIELDFPNEAVEPCLEVPPELYAAIDEEWLFVGKNRMDYLIELRNQKILMDLTPAFAALEKVPARGVIVTAKSDWHDCDFVSRFFAPSVGVPEDPVTGSAHCALAPFWGTRLNKKNLIGYQASVRGGTVHVQLGNQRVFLKGTSVLISKTEMYF